MISVFWVVQALAQEPPLTMKIKDTIVEALEKKVEGMKEREREKECKSVTFRTYQTSQHTK